jgi:hypothetical protein
MSIFSRTALPTFDDAFGADIDDDLAGLDAEVEAEAGEQFGADEDFGEEAFGAEDFGNGVFGYYGVDPSALARSTDLGEDAPNRITLPAGAETALAKAFNPDFLNNIPGWLDWVRSFIPDFLLDQSAVSRNGIQEARDLAREFIKNSYEIDGVVRGAGNWPTMSDAQKMQFINEVCLSAILFNHPDSLDELSATWDKVKEAQGAWDMTKAVGSGWWRVFKAFWMKDVWPLLRGALPFTDQQNFNQLAYAYWASHKTYGAVDWVSTTVSSGLNAFDAYPEIKDQIDAAFAAFDIQATKDERTYVPPAPAPQVEVPTPPAGGYAEESMPTGDSGMLPRPQTVLAAGYLIAVAPTLFRAFR